MVILASSNNKVIARWASALDNATEKTVVSHASDLIDKAGRHPDPVAVIHLSLNGLEGMQGIKRILDEANTTKMLVLEDVPNELHGVELLKSGVLGYGNTYLDPSVLNEAIKVIQMGEIWVSKRLVQWLANNCQSPEHFPDSEDSGLQLNTLTVSENKILNHLLNGESNKAIAKKLNISERTVKAHLTSIFRKTGAKDRLSLALRAFGKNLF
jgi:DNA-binding NarL/FixJ family response regulator